MASKNSHLHRQRYLSWDLLLFVCILMMVLQTSSAFTTQTLERLAQAASLSYLSLDKMPSSPYFDKSRLQPLLQVVDPVSESGATIFMDTSAGADANSSSSSSSRRRVVVACRGSANPKNFGTNLKFKLVPADRLSQTKIPDNAMIHEGFQDASVGLWRRLGPQLLDVLSKNQKSTTTTSSTGTEAAAVTEVVFTGHSLGAATALLCAVHYSSTVKHQQQQKPDVSVITFGGPKLANGVLARHLRNDALNGSTILHLVHDKDPVLANNQKLWNQLGFEDVGIELNCAPKAPIVYTDALDATKKKKSSLFGTFAWNLMDHCNYMGVFVGPRL